jgi:hypothetical protein
LVPADIGAATAADLDNVFTIATAALPKAGGTVTGDLEVDGTATIMSLIALATAVFQAGFSVTAGSGSAPQFSATTAAPANATHLTRKDYVDGQVTTLNGSIATTNTAVAGKMPLTQAIGNVVSGSWTISSADPGRLLTFQSSTAVNLTVPLNSTYAAPIGTRVDFAQMGAGKVTVAPAGGVTVRATPALALRAQYSCGSLVKIGTDEWLLAGDLG